MPSIDYEQARRALEESFALAEASLLKGSEPQFKADIAEACEIIFTSSTQAYREVLLGGTLARIHDKSINIR